jgi:hypothetical protein
MVMFPGQMMLNVYKFTREQYMLIYGMKFWFSPRGFSGLILTRLPPTSQQRPPLSHAGCHRCAAWGGEC